MNDGEAEGHAPVDGPGTHATRPSGLRPRVPRDRSLPRLLLLGTLATVLAACGSEAEDHSADPARGEELYQAHCVDCHGGASGGEISDIPPRHNAEGHTWHHGDCELVEITLEGMPPREGHPRMPAFGDRLDEDDVHDILAHIRTWWEPEQREYQAEVTELHCD